MIAVMLIPQGMAYAALVGVPPVAGLYASIFSLLIYPWFSTAPQLAVGPVAVVSAHPRRGATDRASRACACDTAT